MFAALAAHDVEVLDVEQVTIRGRLIAGVLLVLHGDPAPLRRSIGQTASALGMEHEVVLVENAPPGSPMTEPELLHVIVLGRLLRPGAIAAVCQRIADAGRVRRSRDGRSQHVGDEAVRHRLLTNGLV